MRARLPVFVDTVLGTTMAVGAVAGCLLTSDFDGVVGVRPADAGLADTSDDAPTAPARVIFVVV